MVPGRCQRKVATVGCPKYFLGSIRWRGPMSTILIVILVLLLIGALPTWPHSRSWGYYPSGGLGLVLLILLLLLLMGRI